MKIVKLSAASAAAFSMLMAAGCGNRAVLLTEPFDVAAARQQLQPGSNAIRGSGLVRQQGGGVVTCAGNPVFLMPVTPRAQEWATHVYGSPAGGYRPVGGRGSMFDGAESFFGAVRESICDAQGAFRFDQVADGEFYLFTRILWTVGGLSGTQGGSIMKPVRLTGATMAEVVLAP